MPSDGIAQLAGSASSRGGSRRAAPAHLNPAEETGFGAAELAHRSTPQPPSSDGYTRMMLAADLGHDLVACCVVAVPLKMQAFNEVP